MAPTFATAVACLWLASDDSANRAPSLAAPSPSHRIGPRSRQRSGQPHNLSSHRFVFQSLWVFEIAGRGGGVLSTDTYRTHSDINIDSSKRLAQAQPLRACRRQILPALRLVPWLWLELDGGAAVLRTLFDCRLYHERYHPRLAPCDRRPGRQAAALSDSVALDQPLVPARNTGFPNGDYPSCGRSTWRWLSAARLSSGMASTPLRAWAMIADRFQPFGLGKYATLRAHVMSPTRPSNHLPFPATHIPDARRRWRSPRHLFSSSPHHSAQHSSALTTVVHSLPLSKISRTPKAPVPNTIHDFSAKTYPILMVQSVICWSVMVPSKSTLM